MFLFFIALAIIILAIVDLSTYHTINRNNDELNQRIDDLETYIYNYKQELTSKTLELEKNKKEN